MLVRIAKNQLSRFKALRNFKDRLAPSLKKYAEVDYNLNVTRRHLAALRARGVPAPIGMDVVEIGPGGNLGNALILVAAGARRIYLVDRYRLVDLQSDLAGFYQQLIRKLEAGTEWLWLEPARWSRAQGMEALHCAIQIRNGSVVFNEDQVTYLAPQDARQIALPQASVDWVFSHAVLEHVHDPAKVCQELARILRPGGMTSHQIDLRDHFQNDSLEMLSHPNWLWELMASHSHGYVNRARYPHFERYFREAGIVIDEMRPTRQLDPSIPLPAKLQSEFRGIDETTLRILSVFLVGRKGAGAEPVFRSGDARGSSSPNHTT